MGFFAFYSGDKGGALTGSSQPESAGSLIPCYILTSGKRLIAPHIVNIPEMDELAIHSSPPSTRDDTGNSHTSPRIDALVKRGTPIHRTRTGCLGCRDRKASSNSSKPLPAPDSIRGLP